MVLFRVYSDNVAVVSAKAGKTIAYRSRPPADYSKALEGSGLPATLAHAMAGSDDHATRGALTDTSTTLSKLIGHLTTPMADTVAKAN